MTSPTVAFVGEREVGFEIEKARRCVFGVLGKRPLEVAHRCLLDLERPAVQFHSLLLLVGGLVGYLPLFLSQSDEDLCFRLRADHILVHLSTVSVYFGPVGSSTAQHLRVQGNAFLQLNHCDVHQVPV